MSLPLAVLIFVERVAIGSQTYEVVSVMRQSDRHLHNTSSYESTRRMQKSMPMPIATRRRFGWYFRNALPWNRRKLRLNPT
ncbi:hypothetical protein CC79DRAFT_1337672 [Sarocladium strictum]